MKARQGQNQITHLVHGSGNATTYLSRIKSLAPSYYYDLFIQSHYWNVSSKLIVKKKLTFLATTGSLDRFLKTNQEFLVSDTR